MRSDEVWKSQNRQNDSRWPSRRGRSPGAAEALPVLEFFVSFVSFCSKVLLIFFCSKANALCPATIARRNDHPVAHIPAWRGKGRDGGTGAAGIQP